MTQATIATLDLDNVDKAQDDGIPAVGETTFDHVSTGSVLTVSAEDIYCDPEANIRASQRDEQTYQTTKRQIFSAGGILVPVLCYEVEPSERTLGRKYVLADGFGRYKAITELAAETQDPKWLDSVPIKLTSLRSAADLLMTQLCADTKDALNPIDRARAYRRILDEGVSLADGTKQTLTMSELCAQIGVSSPNMSQSLKLLTLPEPIQKQIQDRQISFSHAREMTRVTNEDDLNRLAGMATNVTIGAFTTFIDNLLAPKAGSGPEVAEGGSQKQKTMVAKSTIDTWRSALKLRLERVKQEENFGAKLYTAEDLLRARADTLAAVECGTSTLTVELAPVIKEIEAEQAKAEARSKAETAMDKFFLDQMSDVIKQHVEAAKLDPLGAKTIASCIADRIASLCSASAEFRAQLEFELSTDPEAIRNGMVKAWADHNAKLQESKKKKEAKKKAEEAAAATAGTPAATVQTATT